MMNIIDSFAPRSIAKWLLLSAVLLVQGLHQACREIGPVVDLGNNLLEVDTTYFASPEAKPPLNILIEEFTGVKCVNCPRAHDLIGNLQAAYPGRVLAAGIHTGFYASPYAGRFDFRISEGPALEQLLGGTLGYPAGAVNRTRFAGENLMLISDQKWSGHVNDLIDDSSIVRIGMTQSLYNASADRMEGRLTVQWCEDLNQNPSNNPVYLSLYLLQNNLIDWQLNTGGVDSQYIHRHVVRRLITPVNGFPLEAQDYRAGRVLEIAFKSVLGNIHPMPVWSDCKWLAVIHQNRNNDLTVLQAAQFPFNRP
jgi:hypothetical protein